MKNLKAAGAVVLLSCMMMVMTSCGTKSTKETAAETTVAETTAAETTVAATTAAETTAAETAEAEIQTLTGEVLDGTMNTVTIKTEDGRELTFGKEDAESDLKDGLLIGNTITIEFTGEISDTDTSAAVVSKITDAE